MMSRGWAQRSPKHNAQQGGRHRGSPGRSFKRAGAGRARKAK